MELIDDRIMATDDAGVPWLNMNLKQKNDFLSEATYKNITALIDNTFLKQQIRAAALEGVSLSKINDNGEMVFFVKSSKHKNNSLIYANTVKFKDWDDVVDETDLNPIGRARLLMFDGNLALNCTCPSFLYWGYRYLLTQHDASIFPETRPPVERNPYQRGIVCKHLNRTIKAFPFYSSDLANYIKRYHDVEPDKDKTVDLKSRIAEHLKDNDDTAADYEDIT